MIARLPLPATLLAATFLLGGCDLEALLADPKMVQKIADAKAGAKKAKKAVAVKGKPAAKKVVKPARKVAQKPAAAAKRPSKAKPVSNAVKPAPKAVKPARTHWDMLMERRTTDDLEVLLKERLDLLRSNEVITSAGRTSAPRRKKTA